MDRWVYTHSLWKQQRCEWQRDWADTEMLGLPTETDTLMWKSVFKDGSGNCFHGPLQHDLAVPLIKKWNISLLLSGLTIVSSRIGQEWNRHFWTYILRGLATFASALLERWDHHVRKLFHELPVQVRCTILDAWGWCTGTTQRDGMGREEGGGFRMGNICIPVVDSFRYLAKLIQLCKV